MNSEQKLLEKFIKDHPLTVLSHLENYNLKELAGFLEMIPVGLSSMLISKMDRYKAIRTLSNIDIKATVQILEQLPLMTSVVLIRGFEQKLMDSIFSRLPDRISAQLQIMIHYPETSVGSHIIPEVFTLFDDDTLEECLEKIKKNNLPVYPHLFVLDRNQTLVGCLEMNDILVSKARQKVGSIMHNVPLEIQADLSIEYLIEGNLWDDSYTALPVVNATNQFLGVITKRTLSEIHLNIKSFDRQANVAGKALGELYRIGLSSLLHSTTNIPLTKKD